MNFQVQPTHFQNLKWIFSFLSRTSSSFHFSFAEHTQHISLECPFLWRSKQISYMFHDDCIIPLYNSFFLGTQTTSQATLVLSACRSLISRRKKLRFRRKIFLGKSFSLKIFSVENILRCLLCTKKINFFFFLHFCCFIYFH